MRESALGMEARFWSKNTKESTVGKRAKQWENLIVKVFNTPPHKCPNFTQPKVC